MNNLKHGFYAHCRASILASTLTLLMPWPLQAQETTETLAKPRPAKVITDPGKQKLKWQ